MEHSLGYGIQNQRRQPSIWWCDSVARRGTEVIEGVDKKINELGRV
jgi:hypothetical protein